MIQTPKLYKYILVLFCITLLLRAVLTVYYNNNLGGIEPNVVYGIQRIMLGHPLYQSLADGNYAIMQYTPLNYYFTASVAKTIGVSALDVHGVYMVCRCLALIFNLLTVLVAAMIIRSWRRDWPPLIYASPVLIMVTAHFYTRGDSMYLFLFAAAMYAAIRYVKSKSLIPLLVAALFSAACIMAKQSGILAIGIIGFYTLFIERKFLHAVVYAVSGVALAYGIAILCIGHDWQAFYQNAYLGLKNGTDFSWLFKIFLLQFFLDMVPCYVVGGIMVWLAIKKISDSTFRFLATGAALSFLFAVVTGLKIGSSTNYFVEFLFFVVVALPLLLEQPQAGYKLFNVKRYTVTVSRFTGIALLILVTSKTIGLFSNIYIQKRFKNEVEEYDAERALYNYFTNDLHLQKGEKIFFTERRFLDNLFIEYALMPNKDVTTQAYLANPATYDYTAFTSGMNNGLIKYIVTSENRNDINVCNDTLPFVQFDKSKFRLLTCKFGFCIYTYTAS